MCNVGTAIVNDINMAYKLHLNLVNRHTSIAWFKISFKKTTKVQRHIWTKSCVEMKSHPDIFCS